MLNSILLIVLGSSTLAQPSSVDPVSSADPPKAQSGTISGVLGTYFVECLEWRINNTESGEAWQFASDEDLSPFVGQQVTAWLNWAVMECGTLQPPVPFVTGVAPTSVDPESWGSIKAKYKAGPSN